MSFWTQGLQDLKLTLTVNVRRFRSSYVGKKSVAINVIPTEVL